MMRNVAAYSEVLIGNCILQILTAAVLEALKEVRAQISI